MRAAYVEGGKRLGITFPSVAAGSILSQVPLKTEHQSAVYVIDAVEAHNARTYRPVDEFFVEARYKSQVWELDTPLPVTRFRSDKDTAKLVEAFHGPGRGEAGDERARGLLQVDDQRGGVLHLDRLDGAVDRAQDRAVLRIADALDRVLHVVGGHEITAVLLVPEVRIEQPDQLLRRGRLAPVETVDAPAQDLRDVPQRGIARGILMIPPTGVRDVEGVVDAVGARQERRSAVEVAQDPVLLEPADMPHLPERWLDEMGPSSEHFGVAEPLEQLELDGPRIGQRRD